MDSASKMLVVFILLSMIVGGFIMLFNEDYRPEKILRTNSSYFPSVDFSPPEKK